MSYRTFTWRPLANPTVTEEFSQLTAQFGDGYEQTAADGINAVRQSWPLAFVGDGLLIAAIRTFLREHRDGKPFYWRPPLETNPKLFRAAQLQVNEISYNWYSLSVTFKEAFAP